MDEEEMEQKLVGWILKVGHGYAPTEIFISINDNHPPEELEPYLIAVYE